ncbi:MAG TPA: aspartyl/asparaginyl beta-hydroxylase domain-containing protein [Verrucomicrobiae bacterium]|nr:aspartyl/asparaginyl beta-hydroxylase domain-containing protein [Verrucomicrobiae bacterium]
MDQTLESDNIGAAAPAVDLRTRKHQLGLPKTFLGRSLLAMQNMMESAVAKVSKQGDPCIYDTSVFPWVAEVEAGWKNVRAELDQVMQYRDQIPSFHEILKEVTTITTDNNWKTYFLAGIGMNCEENARRCPETMKLLKKIPGMKTAFFSILSPHKHIPAHRGAYNGILRLHLGLLVPEPREKVRIRIGNEYRNWSEGKCLIFDDTFNHEVWNDTDGYRVVLFVDFARPLRFPFHQMNEALLNIGALAPFLREAGEKQKKWEKKFYKAGN